MGLQEKYKLCYSSSGWLRSRVWPENKKQKIAILAGEAHESLKLIHLTRLEASNYNTLNARRRFFDTIELFLIQFICIFFQ